MLSRVCHMQKQIATFLRQNNLLTDVTTHLNALNVKFQGKDILVTDMHITAFEVKL